MVDFHLIIEDRVGNVALICKRVLLVPSRLHYCHDFCFTSRCFLVADFTQCPCLALGRDHVRKSSVLGDMGDYDYSSLDL